MLADPHVGDRDPRTEDRQLLLDALLAADRPADRHLHRQRRAHERRRARRPCRSASCSTSSTARCGRDGAPRPVVVRHPLQPFDPRNFTPGALGRRRARGASTASTLAGRARRSPAARARAARRSSPRRCRRARDPVIELDDLVALRRAPGRARSCASGSASASATTPTRSRTRCRSSSTASSSGASASGCSTRGSPAPTRATRRAGRDRPRHAAARACSAQPVIEPVLPDGRGRSSAPRALLGRRAPLGSVDVRVALRRRPHGSAAPCPASAATCCATVTYSRVNPRHRLARLGAAARAHRRATPSAAFEAVDRRAAAAAAARPRHASRGCRRSAPRDARSSTSSALVDLYDRGHARAAAARLQDRRPRTPRPRRDGNAAQAGAASGSPAATSTSEDREPEHRARVRRRADASTSCCARADERGDALGPDEPRASAATPGGCGTACWPRGGAASR